MKTTECGQTILPHGTLNCPKCRAKLFFELAGDMRVKREIEGLMLYEAYCPSSMCPTKGEYVKVIAPKD